MKILFICRGNVGRSQMGAAILKTMRPDLDVVSAGTKVFDKEGRSRHGELLKDLFGAEKVVVSLKEIGIDVSNSSRTQLDENMINDADKIVVMTEPETIPEYLKSSPKAVFWDITDPKEMDLEGTRRIRDKIKKKIMELVKILK